MAKMVKSFIGIILHSCGLEVVYGSFTLGLLSSRALKAFAVIR
jgi:hypothetical protein